MAALAGFRLGAAIGDAYDGDFNAAFMIAAGLSLIGAVVAMVFRSRTHAR